MVLTAADIMRKTPNLVSYDVTVADCARIMSSSGEGFMIITEDKKPVGIVTEWDILTKVLAKGEDPAATKIGSIMTREFIFVSPDTPTEKITELMRDKNIRRLVVMKGNELMGIITSRDILRIFRDYMDNLGAVVNKFGL